MSEEINQKDESIQPSNPFYEIAFRAGLDQLVGRTWPPGRMFDTPGLGGH